MAEKQLQGMRVAILATDDFEESELKQTRQALEDAGAITPVIAPHEGTIQAVRHDEKSDKAKVDIQLDSAHADNSDAELLPGGAVNADALRQPSRAGVRQ